MFTNFSVKSVNLFECENCDYKCYRKYDYDRHLLTRKHKILTNPYKNGVKSVEEKKYVCECGNEYKHRQSLCAHRKKCLHIEKNENENENEKEDLTDYLLKENNELKKMIIDVCKTMQNNNTLTNSCNNNHTNSYNKTFNLQFFLNETCKDAMNLVDFVESIKIQLSDLENVGKNGFIQGISNIIVKNLKALDVTKRPVHCSDYKREVMYVKDDDKWSKEEIENKKLKKAINHVAHKNICLIPEWKAKYPDCIFSDSEKSDQYNHIIYESMDNNDSNSEKIIKKIAKEVIIEKDNFCN